MPDTRNSLILRLPVAADNDAWEQFYAIYQPFVFRLALRTLANVEEARDVAQSVMLKISQAIERFEPSPRCQFRTWLMTIAKREAYDVARRRQRKVVSRGTSSEFDLIANWPGKPVDDGVLVERLELFDRACETIKPTVSEKKWRAFEQTAIHGRDAVSVGEELEMSPGAVYIAKSRIVAALREVVQGMEGTE